jgi:isovaleryl-CoA dehydrogenase
MLESETIETLREIAEEVAHEVLAPRAEEVDREASWPEHSMRALGEAGLLGLHVPTDLGGHGQGLVAVATVTEVLARACPSSAMCFGMHCVGTAVIAAKPTRDQEERYLEPIARGEHITTLALSESGTGSHFYLPATDLIREGDEFRIGGTKQFVTNGGHADSYVVSTRASSAEADRGEFSCIIVDGDQPGLEWLEEWQGFGMRGNSSRGVRLDGVRVPVTNLLGNEGEQVWYMFEVVTPYFITAMAGTYLGIAQGALDAAVRHLTARTHTHTADALADLEVMQIKVAELWAEIEKARLLIRRAARLGDLGDPAALVPLLTSKAEVADVVIDVTNEVMTLVGGIGYRENSTVSRALRDARASHVMAPTTSLLRLWAGRVLLGKPML